MAVPAIEAAAQKHRHGNRKRKCREGQDRCPFDGTEIRTRCKDHRNRRGKHNGKQIGKMSGSGDSYRGEITDPETDKTYAGSGSVSGNSLKMRGCVMAVLCKTQTWSRL